MQTFYASALLQVSIDKQPFTSVVPMVKNLQTVAKLYLLVAVLLAFIIGMGIYGIGQMGTMRENTRTLYNDIVFVQSHILRRPAANIIGLAELFNTDNPADPLNLELKEYRTVPPSSTTSSAGSYAKSRKSAVSKVRSLHNRTDKPVRPLCHAELVSASHLQVCVPRSL